MTYRLIIPGRLDNLNDYIRAERTNQYKGACCKADNEAIVVAAIRDCLRGVHIKRPVTMLYRWYEKDKRRDLDNISSFGRKVIQDALVSREVLADDSWKHIRGFSDEFYVDPDHPRIEVLITEVGG